MNTEMIELLKKADQRGGRLDYQFYVNPKEERKRELACAASAVEMGYLIERSAGRYVLTKSGSEFISMH